MQDENYQFVFELTLTLEKRMYFEIKRVGIHHSISGAAPLHEQDLHAFARKYKY
jgi:hypothetical protein